MPITLIYNAAGKQIHESRNLRGVLDHARRTPVTSVDIGPNDSRGYCVVTFTHRNGDSSEAQFASRDVAYHWVLMRRSWGLKPSNIISREA